MPDRTLNPEKSDAPRRAPAILIIIASLILGLAARGVCVYLAPQSAYLRDHISNMGWGTYAVQHGPWNLYDMPPNQPLIVYKQNSRTGKLGNTIDGNPHALNYPPLGAYLFWSKGLLWHALDSEVVTIGPLSSRVIDTRVSRFCDAFPGIVFDLFLAWGVAALVKALLAPSRRPILEALAFAIVMLAPPIFLDSAHWNQADSWISCWLVWCLVFLMRNRLIAAGVIFGLAIVTKPQAVLFGPVLLYVFLALRFQPDGTWRRALALWKPAVAALLTALFVAVPFMIADAADDKNPDGAWRWFKRSYIGTIGADQYTNRITLNAFNVWWLDMLSQGDPPKDPAGQRRFSQRFLNPDETRLGVKKSTLGKIMLAAGVLVAGGLCARRWRWTTPSWPACAFLVTLAAFTLPTAVHERYIYYCIPFLIALALYEKRWIPPLLALLTVATFEMTSYDWASIQNLYGGDGSARTYSAILAALAVLSLLYSYAVILTRKVRK